MKTCTVCLVPKPEEEFFFKDKNKGKRHSHCKACKRNIDKAHYRSDNDRSKKIRVNARKAIERAKTFVRRVKKQSRCCNCGDSRWYVLDFHHVGKKTNEIADMMRSGVSVKKLKQEMKQCEILCSNCHRERHFLEGYGDLAQSGRAAA